MKTYDNSYWVIDGMDGAGKGSVLARLRGKFPDAVFTREPGGTEFAEKIRQLVRDDPLAGKSTPLNNFLLFWAAREELMHKMEERFMNGNLIISDRGDCSTFAFQMYGEGINFFDSFDHLRQKVFSQKSRKPPDCYIILDLPAEIARQRVLGDGTRGAAGLNHFDERPLEFYERVRHGFRMFASNYENVEFVDATKSPDEVLEQVLSVFAKHGVTS